MHLLLKIMKLYFLELIKKSGIKFTSWLSMVVRVFSLFVMFSIGVLGSPWFSWFSLGFHSFSWFFVVSDNFWRLVSFTGNRFTSLGMPRGLVQLSVPSRLTKTNSNDQIQKN